MLASPSRRRGARAPQSFPSPTAISPTTTTTRRASTTEPSSRLTWSTGLTRCPGSTSLPACATAPSCRSRGRSTTASTRSLPMQTSRPRPDDPRGLSRRPSPVQLLHPRRRSIRRSDRGRPRRRHSAHPLRLARHKLTVKQIIITHAHIDHIAGAASLKKLTGAPVLYNERDIPLARMMDLQAAWVGVASPEVQEPDDDLPDGRLISITGLSGTILHTPGHTQGSVCLHLPNEKLLLAGDTLFAGSVGRTDLPGGDSATLLRSIHERLLILPDDTVVIPGHGWTTTIGEERSRNPYLN